MSDSTAFAPLVLGYAPMIDRHRAVTALRLTITPAITPAKPQQLPDAGALLAALAEFWPVEAGRLSLNIASEPLLAAVLQQVPAQNLMLELPAFMAGDPAHAPALAALHRHGTAILIKGRPSAPLPQSVLDCLAYSIIDLADERRDGLPPPGGQARQIPHVQAGVAHVHEMAYAFGRGAIAVLGWPLGEPLDQAAKACAKKPKRAPELQTIIELINRVDRQESIERIEAVLKLDPTLAFRLIRYINAPAFGLRVEVSSFRHAVMMLGYDRLKRWLALLMVSGSRDPDLKPLVYAAVRRGLLMEELASSADDKQRSELFICGVFSLLDRMLQQPFDDLLQAIPVPEAVRLALLDEASPHTPYLNLVRALESASAWDICEAADSLMMAPQEVNRALLRALLSARQLD